MGFDSLILGLLNHQTEKEKKSALASQLKLEEEARQKEMMFRATQSDPAGASAMYDANMGTANRYSQSSGGALSPWQAFNVLQGRQTPGGAMQDAADYAAKRYASNASAGVAQDRATTSTAGRTVNDNTSGELADTSSNFARAALSKLSEMNANNDMSYAPKRYALQDLLGQGQAVNARRALTSDQFAANHIDSLANRTALNTAITGLGQSFGGQPTADPAINNLYRMNGDTVTQQQIPALMSPENQMFHQMLQMNAGKGPVAGQAPVYGLGGGLNLPAAVPIGHVGAEVAGPVRPALATSSLAAPVTQMMRGNGDLTAPSLAPSVSARTPVAQIQAQDIEPYLKSLQNIDPEMIKRIAEEAHQKAVEDEQKAIFRKALHDAVKAQQKVNKAQKNY